MAETDTPSLIAYSVRQHDGAPDVWTRVGAVFPNGSGEGFNLRLDALPLGHKIVVMPPQDKDNG